MLSVPVPEVIPGGVLCFVVSSSTVTHPTRRVRVSTATIFENRFMTSPFPADGSHTIRLR